MTYFEPENPEMRRHREWKERGVRTIPEDALYTGRIKLLQSDPDEYFRQYPCTIR